MPEDLDALRRENARIEAILAGGVRDQLLRDFGVTHAGVGLKQSGGQVTDELAILAWVPQKIPADQLPAGQLVPGQFAGVRTDINTIPTFEFSDASKYRPVIGGTQITNGIKVINDTGNGTQMESGTIGCLATTAGGDTVLLTNWHVLTANSGKVGNPVFQPTIAPEVDSLTDDYPKHPASSDNAIAKIAKVQVDADVDAAIATINTCYSLCCNCGVHFDNTILGLAINGVDTIADVSAAVGGQQVVKVGKSTGRTEGKVITATLPTATVTLEGTSYTFTNQIQISGNSGAFSAHGDSGAAIISATDGTMIGLLFATSNDPVNPTTLANHIEKVTAAMGITINVTPPGGGGTSASVASPLATEPDDSLLEMASARLSRTPEGRALLAGFERHCDEAIALVQGDRRVTLAWHRHHGPQWLAHLARNARRHEFVLPERVEGVRLRELLLAMADALELAASAPLATEVCRQRPKVERLPDQVACIDDLFTLATPATTVDA